jgi:5-(carboxyamino)imidazole ribonucleotide synthase
MSDFPSPGATIGIIGGGQLGRMLAIAAARLGYRTAILEPQADCPAAQTANIHIEAGYDDAEGLKRLAACSDVITYEFENVPVAAAERLAGTVPVFPPPRALAVAQDRITEKDFLNGAGIGTAPYLAVESADELARGLEKFGGSGVLKTRRFGYDGKGQRLFRDAAPADAAGIVDEMGGGLILEGLVDFTCEISVIAARGRDGAMLAFDPARNEHRDGILRVSTVPSGVAPETADAARKAAFAVLEALDYVGVIGVEFFVLRDGSVLANEIAPRVHNSGHWTEAACVVSQFEQHIRAVAGLKLGGTARHSDCVMENLIGDDVARVPQLLAEPDVLLHLYGKAETRPGRKMGHFTRLTGPTPSLRG